MIRTIYSIRGSPGKREAFSSAYAMSWRWMLILGSLMVAFLIKPTYDASAVSIVVTNLSAADVHFDPSNTGNSNQGLHYCINADNNGARRMLIRWNLTNIPAGATINYAQAKIYRYSSTDITDGLPFSTYRVTSAWTDGYGASNGSTPSPFYPSGANWVYRKIEGEDGYGEGDPLDNDSPSQWTTAGGDYDGASRVQFTGATVLDPANGANFGMQPVITEIVSNWVSITDFKTNYGIIVISDETAIKRHAMRSREFPDDGKVHLTPGVFAPQLVIDYTAVPAVTNSGPTNETYHSAVLKGTLTLGGTADAWVCWGLNDEGVESTGKWDHVTYVGVATQNVMFAALADGMRFNGTYWYRCYVTNIFGTAWSSPATSFSAFQKIGTVLRVH